MTDTTLLSETLLLQNFPKKTPQQATIAFTAQSFFALAQNCPDIICRFDREYYHLYVNPAIEKITGNSPSLFIGKKTDSVGMAPDFTQFWNMKIKMVFDTKEPIMFEFDFPTPNGMKYFQTSVVPEFDSDGTIQTVLSISRDISLMREHEKEKDAFIAMVTHELKTPITTIKAFAQLLEKKLTQEGNKEHALYLTKIDRQINKLNKQIGDLLEVTRIGAGKMQCKEGVFDFNDLLTEIVSDTKKMTTSHPIMLKKTVSATIIGDKDRTGQVLLNLLSNAIKYSPDSLPITISTKKDGHFLLCTVHDLGKGIPKDLQGKLFQRFSRLTNEQHTDSPGLGLGLYISSEIIKREGGKLWVESELGKGTSFHFTLPIQVKAKKTATSLGADERS